MTKKEIVRKIAGELSLSQGLVHDVVQRAFDEIVEALIRERRIELRNFGVFDVRIRAARKARNPRTNERLDVPRRMAVVFRPGKEMMERIAEMAFGDSGRADGRPPQTPSEDSPATAEDPENV